VNSADPAVPASLAPAIQAVVGLESLARSRPAAPAEVPVIPEGESLGLVLCGLAMLLCLARFRRRR
jgi:hypothetical protein